MPSWVALVALSIVLAGSGTASAFGGEAKDSSEPAPLAKKKKTKAKAKDSSAPVVTFSAFSAQPDGGATIRLDMTREARVSMQNDDKNEKVVVFRLQDADVRDKNNENPLYAEHFRTVVQRVKLDRGDEGVTVTILLRQKTKISHHYEERDGVTSLYIDVAAPPAEGGSGS